jgi:hypothetical protein
LTLAFLFCSNPFPGLARDHSGRDHDCRDAQSGAAAPSPSP